MGGQKFDNGKLLWHLLPVRPMEGLVKTFTIGAGKYGENNWRKGIAFSRLFAAMCRHLFAWWRGEKFDPEDGQHHLASVAWGALVLMELEETHPNLDDRAEPEANPK
jgi:hypothetical protein